MGKAILLVTAQLLVEMSKASSEPRYATVTANAVPDDARVVELRPSEDGTIAVVLESAAFPEEGEPALPAPQLTIMKRVAQPYEMAERVVPI